MTDPDAPPFSLTKPRYNLSTFTGRLQHFFSVTDFRTLFYTHTDVEASKVLLEQYKTKTLGPNVTDGDLWHARRVLDSSLHPDTGEPIPRLFRFSAFSPVNIFLVTGMLLPSTISSVPRTIFFHWLNQSYNAAVNFSNRSVSADIPVSTLVEGYCGAVGSAIGVALGATFITKRLGSGGGAAFAARLLLPYAAVCTAGCVNLYLMRKTDLAEGAVMKDEFGNVYGKSPEAAKVGFLKCCGARLLWNTPIMLIPPLIMARLGTTALLASNPTLRLLTEIGVITGMLFAGVPPALAAFPQLDTIHTSKLEPQFQNLHDSRGVLVEHLYYNKGL